MTMPRMRAHPRLLSTAITWVSTKQTALGNAREGQQNQDGCRILIRRAVEKAEQRTRLNARDDH